MAQPKKVVIIGAGIGGLALATMLAKTGYAVSIYEKGSRPGGRIGLLEQDGFRFDTGPSWYLMPEIFEHYFELIGEDLSKYLKLVRLDPAYRVVFENQASITIHGDQKKDSQTFERLESGSARRLEDYLQNAESMYELAKQYFLYNNFSNPLNMLAKETVRAAPGMLRVLTHTLDQNAARYIHDQSLRHILEYPSVFLGCSPYNAPAIYSLMSYLDFKQGVFYPMGGMYTIIEALVRIGRKFGVEYHYNASVEKIITDGRKATGLRIHNGKEVSADIVVSNADLHFTEASLLPKHLQSYPENYWSKATPGPSALLMYLGIKGTLPSFGHHNLLFSDDWKRSFETLFKQHSWPNPASLYICVPSMTDPSVAPKGYQNMFVLVPGPAGQHTDQASLETLANGYLRQIARMTGTADLQERIVTKKLFGPSDFANQFNAWQGTALGMSHTLRQSAFFRPKNKSKKISNLFYVGSGTVPGIGLPMCLISAEAVYKRLINDTTSGPLNGLVGS